MGHGSYSYSGRMKRAVSKGYNTKSAREIFTQQTIKNAMSPEGVVLRESRDSTEHPNSVPIILALDETGSMGTIPHFLVREGLPHMMDKIIKSGVPDPQVLFLGVGDHKCDRAPLQVGQFESSDELLDQWLTDLYLEGNGGGNGGESYLLAWLFAGRYTESDHFQKRKQKGILFTVGDEPVHNSISANEQRSILGPGEYSDQTAAELLELAKEQYEVYHLHLVQGHHGTKQSVKNGWIELLGDNVLFIEGKEEVAQVIADKVLEVVSAQNNEVTTVVHQEASEPEEMML